MKICITSQMNGLDSQVDPRFGRCQYFVIYDTETLESEFIENLNKDGMGGVGIQSGQAMIDKGVKVVLTGHVGPNAYKTLDAAGIKVVSGVSGQIVNVIDQYVKGELNASGGPDVDSHFGSAGDQNK